MIPIYKLYEFDAEEAGSYIKKAGSWLANKAGDAGRGMAKFGRGVLGGKEAEDRQYKLGIKHGEGKYDARLRNDTQFRREKMAGAVGQELSNAAKATSKFVGQNQKLVGGAGLVGAGVLANRMMNRNRPV